ncbi:MULTISPECIES: acyltransferase family protein [unclassified Yoonia]|uniref:acyltransferase family protein n=1 Tax=unclassified Yoonia TaxID=2629118 RepID=UPI002AFE270D|nr:MULTISPECIES: acyltransferase family protein [unclassified Yoonia]
MHYRREIDGLRAIAVLPVILFHAGFSAFSGGFVGVDVFFVISGYLITRILIDEMAQGHFSILRFYERRARRILPALFVVMLACLPFAYMWMLPSQLQAFGQSLIAVVFFGSNVLFWLEGGYFAAAAELKPLLHTWSLAVEEQFYLLFPVFLLWGWRFGRTRLLWGIIAVAVCSLLLSELTGRRDPDANFYLITTRAWELLVGSVCAFLTYGRAQRSNEPLAALGLGLIVFAVFTFDDQTPFPGVYALLPVGGTALVILFAGQRTWAARVLATRGFVGIGLISYSAYLWHQPLFAFARLRSTTEPSEALMLGLACAALLLAWATWYWVEQPFRNRSTPLLRSQRHVFLASGTFGALIVAIGLVVHLGDGFPSRKNGEISFATLDNRLAPNPGLHRDCMGNYIAAPPCLTSPTPDVLLWGDSFAGHLAPGMIASEASLGMQQFTLQSCAPVLGIAQVFTQGWAEGCIAFNDRVLAWVRAQTDLRLVVLSSPFDHLFRDGLQAASGDLIPGPDLPFVAEQLIATAQAIRETGADVIIVSPMPRTGWNIGQCLMRSVYFGMDEATCDFALRADSAVDVMLRMVAEEVPVYWLHDDFCRNGMCDAMQDGTFVYMDFGHLSNEGSAHLGRVNDWMGRFRAMAQDR